MEPDARQNAQHARARASSGLKRWRLAKLVAKEAVADGTVVVVLDAKVQVRAEVGAGTEPQTKPHDRKRRVNKMEVAVPA